MPCVAEVVNRSLKADCTDFRHSVLANNVKLNEKSGLKLWVSERHRKMILDCKLAETAWVDCHFRDFCTPSFSSLSPS